MHQPAHTPAGIATHRRLAAVGVEKTHAEVGNGRVRTADEHQAVATYAKVAVAPLDCSRAGIGDVILCCIDVDVVVASPVHFGKSYLHKKVNVGCDLAKLHIPANTAIARA